MFGLVGESGSGKSKLGKLLAQAMPVDAGRIDLWPDDATASATATTGAAPAPDRALLSDEDYSPIAARITWRWRIMWRRGLR